MGSRVPSSAVAPLRLWLRAGLLCTLVHTALGCSFALRHAGTVELTSVAPTSDPDRVLLTLTEADGNGGWRRATSAEVSVSESLRAENAPLAVLGGLSDALYSLEAALGPCASTEGLSVTFTFDVATNTTEMLAVQGGVTVAIASVGVGRFVLVQWFMIPAARTLHVLHRTDDPFRSSGPDSESILTVQLDGEVDGQGRAKHVEFTPWSTHSVFDEYNPAAVVYDSVFDDGLAVLVALRLPCCICRSFEWYYLPNGSTAKGMLPVPAWDTLQGTAIDVQLRRAYGVRADALLVTDLSEGTLETGRFTYDYLKEAMGGTDEGLSAGAIAGIVIGCVVGVLLIVLAVVMVRKRLRAGKGGMEGAKEPMSEGVNQPMAPVKGRTEMVKEPTEIVKEPMDTVKAPMETVKEPMESA